VRPGAEVNEVAVLEIGNRLALGNLVEQVELELGDCVSLTKPAQPATFRVGDGLLARDGEFLENIVRLDLLLHLHLDGREIFGRDATKKFTLTSPWPSPLPPRERRGKRVVIEAILDGRPVGELRVGPEAQDGGGHDVGARVPDALQLGHLRAVVESFALGVRLRLRLIRLLLIFVGYKIFFIVAADVRRLTFLF
jgi:hypothetical protein